MKIICTVSLMLFLAIPVLAQDNNSVSKDDRKNDDLNSASKVMSTLLSKNQHPKLYKSPNFLYRPKSGFGFIPIPPGTEANRRAEMIPLYREGKRIVKFIKK